MTNRPPVGNFRSTPGNAPRQSAEKSAAAAPTPPAPEPVTPTLIPASMSRPAAPPEAPRAPPEAEEPEVELTPRERYEQRLADANISRSMANAIFDAVMSKDYYEEYVQVGSNRAVFRTRMYDDHLRLQTALELQRPGLVLTQEDMITRYNLAASLHEWRGKPIPHNSDDDFDKAMTIVKKMPAPVYSLLAQKLAEFDRKVMTVFSDGATESF